MRTTCFAIGFGLIVAATGVAFAQDPAKEALPAEVENQPAPQASARFSLSKVDGGFLRLDSMNGQISFCSQREAGWTCQVVPEDRAALDAEIARLQGEVASLKSEIARNDMAKAAPPRPPGDLSPRPDGKTEPTVRLPTREEMEKAKAAFERVWRHFVDMISDFQKDLMKKG